MNPNINDLRTYNRCPLLYEQRGFYQSTSGQSSLLLGKLQTVFGNVFYETMRGTKITDRRIAKYWSEAISPLLKSSAPITEKDLQFPAQCLAIFMDMYGSYSKEEIVGPSVPIEVPISPHTIVEDFYPLLTRTNYGMRITVFEFQPSIRSEVHYTNDFFLSIYSHAYRREFNHPEFCITICNLGDGKTIDLVRSDNLLKSHMNILSELGERFHLAAHVPSLSSCPQCPIYSPCSLVRYGTR